MMGNTGDPEYMAAYIRARALADAERAARAYPHSCNAIHPVPVDECLGCLAERQPHRCSCWTPLYPYEVTPPGGPTMTLTTCPVCDRWRPEDDR